MGEFHYGQQVGKVYQRGLDGFQILKNTLKNLEIGIPFSYNFRSLEKKMQKKKKDLFLRSFT